MEILKTTPDITTLQNIQEHLSKANIESIIRENSAPYINESGYTITYSLLVADEDIEKALEIIKPLSAKIDLPQDCSWCPKCGSDNISKEVIRRKYASPLFLIFGILAFIAALIIPLPWEFRWLFLFGGIFAVIQFFRGHTEEHYVCHNCNHKFKRY